MPQLITICDGGFDVIEHNSRYVNVGKIIIRVSENESAPIDHIAYCQPNHKESIIKNLKRLVFLKPAAVKRGGTAL